MATRKEDAIWSQLCRFECSDFVKGPLFFNGLNSPPLTVSLMKPFFIPLLKIKPVEMSMIVRNCGRKFDG